MPDARLVPGGRIRTVECDHSEHDDEITTLYAVDCDLQEKHRKHERWQNILIRRKYGPTSGKVNLAAIDMSYEFQLEMAQMGSYVMADGMAMQRVLVGSLFQYQRTLQLSLPIWEHV